MTRKLVLGMTICVMALCLMVSSSNAGDPRRAIKREHEENRIRTVTSLAGTYREIESVRITVPRRGNVKVTASGMVAFPDTEQDFELTMTLAKRSAAPGPWVHTTRGIDFVSYNVEHIFPVSSGTTTFFFNAASFGGTAPGLISVQNGMLEALWLNSNISADTEESSTSSASSSNVSND